MTKEFDLDLVWSSLSHTTFLESLNAEQSGALLRLLMVATFADGKVTDEERTALGRAITDMPAFAGTIDFTGERGAAVLDNMRQRYEADRAALLKEIAEGLGDETARRHAFRTAVEVLQSDGFDAVEADFVREIGALFELDDEVLDYVLKELN
jgi:tellurite resistance protein